jgi:hypothetical protein
VVVVDDVVTADVGCADRAAVPLLAHDPRDVVGLEPVLREVARDVDAGLAPDLESVSCGCVWGEAALW